MIVTDAEWNALKPTIALIQSDIWIGFPRAEQVLDRMLGLIGMPQLTRMPGRLVPLKHLVPTDPAGRGC